MRHHTVLALLVAAVVLTAFATPGAAASASIDADPNTADATSTHSVVSVVGADADSSSLNGLNVDYQSTDQNGDVANVDKSDIVKVGIDRGGNDSGTTIDVDVSDDLSGVGASNNGETLEIDFGGSYNLQEGDEVVAVYEDAENPAAGDYTIDFVVNPQSAGSDSSATLSIESDSTATPTPTATATPTPTPTATATANSTPTATPTSTATPTDESTATPTTTTTSTVTEESGSTGDGATDLDWMDEIAACSRDDTDGNATVGDARNVEVGDSRQNVTNLAVSGTAACAGNVDVYLNVTGLEAADVGLENLSVRVNRSTVDNATIVDRTVNRSAGNTTVRLTFDVDDDHDSFAVGTISLQGLETEGATTEDDLRHYVAVADSERFGTAAPGPDDATTTTFGVARNEARSVPLPPGGDNAEAGVPTQQSGLFGSVFGVVGAAILLALIGVAVFAYRRIE